MTRKLSNYPWLKAYVDWLNNKTYMHLANSTKGIYQMLYLLAGRGDAGGVIGYDGEVFTLDEISWQLRLNEQDLEAAITELLKAGLLAEEDGGYSIARFMEEQGPGAEEKREGWRQRQAKHRAKAQDKVSDSDKESEREEECHRDITQCHGDTETPRANDDAFASLLDDWRSITGHSLPARFKPTFQEAMTKYYKQLCEWHETVGPFQEEAAERLKECHGAWLQRVQKHNYRARSTEWKGYNPAAIIELIPLPELEVSMRQEKMVFQDAARQVEANAAIERFCVNAADYLPQAADSLPFFGTVHDTAAVTDESTGGMYL